MVQFPDPFGIDVPLLAGAGGGEEPDPPVEYDDDLASTQYAELIDVVCEGEIEGLVDGGDSVFFDGTALETDGKRNFKGVRFEYRTGTTTQSPLSLLVASAAERAVGVQVTNAISVTRTVSDTNVNAVSVTLNVPALMEQTEDGDLVGSKAELQIQVRPNGGAFAVQKVADGLADIPFDGATATADINSSRMVLRWRAGTPNGKQTNIPPTILVEYREVGSSTWLTWGTQALEFENKKKQQAKGRTVLQLPIARWEARGTIVDPTYGTNLRITSAKGGTLVNKIVFEGKASGGYSKTVWFYLTGSPPWDIKIVRLTADPTTVKTKNETYWTSYTEFVGGRLQYRNTAVFLTRFNASRFRAIPQRAYELKLLRIKVPTNYDPLYRTYSGLWDGTFKIAWTDNPAWCFYDLLTHSRYGLGAYISESSVDKWALYQIAQYCDQLVPDGEGGYEPRFTCNLYLQSREEAFRVLQNLASIFRGIIFYRTGGATAVADKPADPAYLFTSANVVDGTFQYSGTGRRTRQTVALVAWNDPADNYKRKIEYVEDAAGIARYGIIQTEVIAVGCTSRGQAHRTGKWILYTNQSETETVVFKTGLEGAAIIPGDVILIQDQFRAGQRFGGRIHAADLSSITLDAPVTLIAGKSYSLSVLLPDGNPETRSVTTGAGQQSVLTVSPAYSAAPLAGTVWILAASDLSPTYWRVLSIVEREGYVAEVTAAAHNPGKYDLIENGWALPDLDYSAIQPHAITEPLNLSVAEYLYIDKAQIKVKIDLSWSVPPGAVRFSVRYRLNGSEWINADTVENPRIDFLDAQPGEYYFSVVAHNPYGLQSPEALLGPVTILGKTAPPPNVDTFALDELPDGTRQFRFSLDNPPLDLSGYVLRYGYGTQTDWDALLPLHTGEIQFSPWETTQIAQGLYTFAIRAIDTSGNLSTDAAFLQKTLNGNPIANAIASKLPPSELWGGSITYA
jgi:predicted phage tail protein